MTPKPKTLDHVLAELLERRRARGLHRSLTTVPPGMIDFSSNAYLSLSTHAPVQAAFLTTLQSLAVNGSPLLGSGGSRLLDGNSLQAECLEETIAAFHNASAGLLFNSAMDANLGLFGCVPQPGDTIVYDELIHASVHDGMRLSRAGSKIPFAHNCVWTCEKSTNSQELGVLDALEGVLQALKSGVDGHVFVSGERNVFIAVEGVYSMDGDVVPLGEVVKCVEENLPEGNGHIIVDEAHSVGIFGQNGKGLTCQLGLEERVWARVMGLGKAMSCSGGRSTLGGDTALAEADVSSSGIVLCSKITRSYLINYARSLIYTTAMAIPSLTAIQVTYKFIMSGRAEPLLHHLRRITLQTHELLLELCLRLSPPRHVLRINPAEPKSPIIPVFTSQPRSLAQHCQRQGFMVRPIVAPTVPKGSERIRVCLHAGNTTEHVKGLIDAVEAWVVVAHALETGQSGGKKAKL